MEIPFEKLGLLSDSYVFSFHSTRHLKSWGDDALMLNIAHVINVMYYVKDRSWTNAQVWWSGSLVTTRLGGQGGPRGPQPLSFGTTKNKCVSNKRTINVFVYCS